MFNVWTLKELCCYTQNCVLLLTSDAYKSTMLQCSPNRQTCSVGQKTSLYVSKCPGTFKHGARGFSTAPTQAGAAFGIHRHRVLCQRWNTESVWSLTAMIARTGRRRFLTTCPNVLRRNILTATFHPQNTEVKISCLFNSFISCIIHGVVICKPTVWGDCLRVWGEHFLCNHKSKGVNIPQERMGC